MEEEEYGGGGEYGEGEQYTAMQVQSEQLYAWVIYYTIHNICRETQPR